MKTLLLVFVVLLFLLTLLSSFGGSIRTNEPFYDATPALREEETYTNTMPPADMMPQPENFYPTMDANKPMESFYANLGTPLKQEAQEDFYSDVPSIPMSTVSSAMPMPTMDNVPKPPSFPTMAVPETKNDAVADQEREQYVNYEKIEVPEPFFNDDKFAGAPL